MHSSADNTRDNGALPSLRQCPTQLCHSSTHLPAPVPVTSDVEADPLLGATSVPVSLYADCPTTRAQSPVIAAYTTLFASTLAFSASSFLVHLAEVRYDFPATLAVFVRGVIQASLAFTYFCFTPSFRRSLCSLTLTETICVLIRSIAGTLSTAALYAGVKLAPVGDVVAIYSSSPAISVGLAAAVLGEAVPLFHLGAAFMAALGAMCVASPEGLQSFHLHSASGAWNKHAVGAALALCAAVLASMSLTALRRLAINAHFMVAVLAFGVSAAIMGSPFLLDISAAEMLQRKYIYGGLAVVASAVAGFTGQCCISRALKDCPVAPAAVLLNLEVPMSYMLGLMFLGEQPTVTQSIGSLLIMVSAVFLRLN